MSSIALVNGVEMSLGGAFQLQPAMCSVCHSSVRFMLRISAFQHCGCAPTLPCSPYASPTAFLEGRDVAPPTCAPHCGACAVPAAPWWRQLEAVSGSRPKSRSTCTRPKHGPAVSLTSRSSRSWPTVCAWPMRPSPRRAMLGRTSFVASREASFAPTLASTVPWDATVACFASIPGQASSGWCHAGVTGIGACR